MMISVKDFGAVGNGNADDTASIQAAINSVSGFEKGGTVYFPPGNYRITQTLSVSESNVRLVGEGIGNAIGGAESTKGSTKLIWGGAVNGTMLRIETPVGVEKRYGSSASHMAIIGVGTADIGLELVSVNGGQFDDLAISDTRIACYKLTTRLPTEVFASDNQQNIFTNCRHETVANGDARGSRGWWLTAGSLDGGDTSGNMFIGCTGLTWGDTGGPDAAWYMPRADGNYFVRCAVNLIGNHNGVTNGFLIAGEAGYTGTNRFFSCDSGGPPSFGFRIKGRASGFAFDPLDQSFCEMGTLQMVKADANCTYNWSGIDGRVVLRSFTVAGLPPCPPGGIAYASNGRKVGENPNRGTGVLVYHDSSGWKACDSGKTVAA